MTFCSISERTTIPCGLKIDGLADYQVFSWRMASLSRSGRSRVSTLEHPRSIFTRTNRDTGDDRCTPTSQGLAVDRPVQISHVRRGSWGRPRNRFTSRTFSARALPPARYRLADWVSVCRAYEAGVTVTFGTDYVGTVLISLDKNVEEMLLYLKQVGIDLMDSVKAETGPAS